MRKRGKLILVAITLLLAVVLGNLAWQRHSAYQSNVLPPGTPPYDPHPLMAQLETRITTNRFRFAVVGDLQNGAAVPAVLKFLDEQVRPDFVVCTGDLVQGGGGELGRNYWEAFLRHSGAELRKRPWWPALGNHELAYGDWSRARFQSVFKLTDGPYCVHFKNAAFVFLPWRYPEGETLEWLVRTLETEASRPGIDHLFVINHAPFYTIGSKARVSPNEAGAVSRLFASHKVSLVFSGHDHIYYRTLRDGVPYLVCGGGGAPLYRLQYRQLAQAEDVYYGAVGSEETTTSEARADDDATEQEPRERWKYLYHNGCTNVSDRVTDTPEHFLLAVDVDEKTVTIRCLTTSGGVLDELVFSSRNTKE